MRTYGVSMIQSQDRLVPVIMPFFSAQAQNTLERGSRPYSVVEILREVFKEDFFKRIQHYMDHCPEKAAIAIHVSGARELRLLWLSEPMVESSLHQPACTTAVDLVFRASVENIALDKSPCLLVGRPAAVKTTLVLVLVLTAVVWPAPPAGGFIILFLEKQLSGYV